MMRVWIRNIGFAVASWCLILSFESPSIGQEPGDFDSTDSDFVRVALASLRSQGLSGDLETRIEAFLARGSVDSETGFKLEQALSNHRLRERGLSDKTEIQRLKYDSALELIEKYPDLEASYRHLLSVSWKADEKMARAAIDVVISGSDSSGVKKRATRLLKSLDSGLPRPDTEQDLLKILSRGALREDMLTRVERFLSYDDREVGEGARFRVDMAFRHARLRSEGPAGIEERRLARMNDAQDLISKYPKEDGAYRYLLALARDSGALRARKAARLVLNGEASESVKKGARRLLRYLDMKNNQFKPAWLGLEEMPDKGLVIYGWSANRPPQPMLHSELADELDLVFVGVNFDGDGELAASLAEEWNLPGEQRVCKGLESRVADRLGVVSEAFVYFVREDGSFEDMTAHRDFSRKLAKFASIELFEIGATE